MLIGLTGPTDLYDLRRERIAHGFCKHVFYFDDLTLQFIKELKIQYNGKSYEELLQQQDRAAIVAMKQQVWEGLHRIDPKIYTDWMTLQLARTVFAKGLKTSTKVTEAVIGDVKGETQARWLRKFAIDRHNRSNKLVKVCAEPLPSPLGDHLSEQNIAEVDQTFDMSVPIDKEVDRIRRAIYTE